MNKKNHPYENGFHVKPIVYFTDEKAVRTYYLINMRDHWQKIFQQFPTGRQ